MKARGCFPTDAAIALASRLWLFADPPPCREPQEDEFLVIGSESRSLSDQLLKQLPDTSASENDSRLEYFDPQFNVKFIRVMANIKTEFTSCLRSHLHHHGVETPKFNKLT